MSIEMGIVAAIIIIGTAKVAGWFMRFLSWMEASGESRRRTVHDAHTGHQRIHERKERP